MRLATFTSIVMILMLAHPSTGQQKNSIFNVREFGATGNKKDNAQKSIQQAVDACALQGGGMVYLPPGEYSSGTIHLKSHVRFHIEAGATLLSIKDKNAFDQDALIFADGAENISIEGRGTVDGQGRYETRLNDVEDDFIRPNMDQMTSQGKPLLRSFPLKNQFGKIMLLLRCKDVRITEVSLIDSPSWTMHLYGCERVIIDGIYIHSSLKDGVWADGIDPDGCKDVRISNCTIETGDDALVFYSMNWYGPALPCENITVTNCRLTSSSSAIKFCDGNMNAVRNVTIDNCVITASNRGIAFMNFDGGTVSDVVLSNLTIDCIRKDWFWWGDGDPIHFNIKRRSEVHKSIKPENDKNPAGKIQRVLISHVIARGMGSSICTGHPDSWLEDITLNDVKLYLSHDARSPYDKSRNALEFKNVKNLKLKDVDISWEGTPYEKWESALTLENISGLEIDGFSGRPAVTRYPAVQLNQVWDAVIRNSRARNDTDVFLFIYGSKSGEILLRGNDFRFAKIPYRIDHGLADSIVRFESNSGDKP